MASQEEEEQAEVRLPSIFVKNLKQDLPKQVIRQVFEAHGADEGLENNLAMLIVNSKGLFKVFCGSF